MHTTRFTARHKKGTTNKHPTTPKTGSRRNPKARQARHKVVGAALGASDLLLEAQVLGHLLVDLFAACRGVEAVVGGDVVQLVGDLLQGPVVGGTAAAFELVPHAGHHLLALQRQEGHEHVDQVFVHNVRTIQAPCGRNTALGSRTTPKTAFLAWGIDRLQSLRRDAPRSALAGWTCTNGGKLHLERRTLLFIPG